MPTPKYYLVDENKNLIEGYDKESFLALLRQAIEDGNLENIDADSAFVTKIKSQLNGTTHHMEFITQAQYNQLVADEELVPNTYYFITDDTTADDLEEEVSKILDGTTVVPKADNANNADLTSFTNQEPIRLNVGGQNMGIFEITDSLLINALRDHICLVWFEVQRDNSEVFDIYNVGLMLPCKLNQRGEGSSSIVYYGAITTNSSLFNFKNEARTLSFLDDQVFTHRFSGSVTVSQAETFDINTYLCVKPIR